MDWGSCVIMNLAFNRSDLSGGGNHVLAGLGNGSSGGNFSVYTCGVLSGLLSASGGGLPACWGHHVLFSWSKLGQRVFIFARMLKQA